MEPGLGAAPQETPGWRGARNGNFAAAVYGSILAAGVVASLDVGDVGDTDMTIALGGTMLVFWLAHVWAEGISDRMHDPRPYTWRRLRAVAAWHWPMVQAAAGPLAALVLADVGALSLDTAVTVALAVSVAQLVGWGVAVGWRTFGGWPAALLSGAVDGLLGVVLIVLKTLVH
ncbi:MAG TPA: hypothetical protein VFS37_00185 [Conexibacter sp.]|nr:hypothetical protein [Conexibacter sp.]